MNAFTSHYCQDCEQKVLTYGDLENEIDLVLRCLDCNVIIEEKEAPSSFSPDELQKMGYNLGIKDDSGKKGCRDGACGIQQL